ncbi:hypothetical protein Atai01_02890 [Amycolatopsis taiwanensis]|uniref:Uncharacterized protein n=1 Tax=Amycolatopsis taiwanensis TaxID=342230 RepID=A0A9W6QXA7_9PSEU|nr:hypothetical protein Atai01_02890 [Amycolatopsis taiwanensis]
MSYAQIERWRARGLVPRNIRHSHGRGRGSGATLAAGALPAVLALAKYARRGVSLHATTLAWFLEAHLSESPAWTGAPVPEPPEAPVRAALLWQYDRTTSRIPANVGADERDLDLIAETIRRNTARSGVMEIDLVGRMGEFVRTGALPGGERRSARAAREGVTTIALAQALGFDEVGSDAMMHALTDLGSVPADYLDSARRLLVAGELTGKPSVVIPDRREQRKRLQATTHQELIGARNLAQELLGAVGALQLFRMLGVSNRETDRLRATFVRAGLGVLFIGGLVKVHDADTVVPVMTALLDPTVRAVAEYVHAHLHDGSFGDIHALFDRAERYLTQRRADPR